ncbi:hypothetical protein ACFL2U_02600, partial [Patescibacteria group bacterium]
TCLVLTATLLLFLIYYLFVFLGVVNINIIYTYNLIWKTASSIIYFIIAVIAQILIINAFFQPKINFTENLKSLKKHFWGYFYLTIILYILFAFFTLPVYVGISLLAFNNTILGLLSFFLGILLSLFLVSYVIFSPFLLIDKNMGCIQAIKKSIALTQNNLANIIARVIFLTIILTILNIISTYLVPFYTLGKMYYIVGLIGIILVLVMILLAFAYLFAMYQNFKSLKNVE